MPNVYIITGNTLLGDYRDSVTLVDAKETKNSLMWSGRRLDKNKLDVYDTGATIDSIRVYTTDESKVEGHVREVRKRIREQLELVKSQAMSSESKMAVRIHDAKAADWRSWMRIHEEV
ncbi:hypothetical protein D3C76_622230 [compost metagenome]